MTYNEQKTTTRWKGKKISAVMCITCENTGYPMVGITEWTPFLDGNGEKIRFEETEEGDNEFNAVVSSLCVQYKIDNAQYIKTELFRGKPLDAGFDPEKIPTKVVATLTGSECNTAQKWAKKNGVKFVGEEKRKDYKWDQNDIARFIAREKPGRRWNKNTDTTA
jgi:hypothetical protein